MPDTGSGKEEVRVAVALKYEPGKDVAPKVTAKGLGDTARKIVEIAEASGVHVEHNAPLAQALSHLDFGEQIPKELFRAVAEVVGFVLRKSGEISKVRQPPP